MAAGRQKDRVGRLFVTLITVFFCLAWCLAASAADAASGHSASSHSHSRHKHPTKHRKHPRKKSRHGPASPPTAVGSGATETLSGQKIEPYSLHPSGNNPYYACPPATRERASCDLIVVPGGGERPVSGPRLNSVEPPEGALSPSDLQSAYNVSVEGGSGQTVAVVIPYDHPGAEAGLGVYRKYYGLPACTTANGCFKRVDLGATGGTSGWAMEVSMDLDMVSSTCPLCHLILVESECEVIQCIVKAVNTAANMSGVTAVSLSYGNFEEAGDAAYNSFLDHPGTPILVASHDSANVYYPAASPNVIAVGGTYLLRNKESPRGWTESAWQGAGSGCSKYQPKPIWQKDTGCDHRAVADVSAVADPYTPVSAYSSETVEGAPSPGWFGGSGTSASAPIVAGIEATKSKTFREAGAKAFYEAGEHHELYDVVGGANKNCLNFPFQGHYLCEGLAGYDGPTGMGTPGIPLPGPPASTETPTLLEPEEATLNGAVNPQGSATTYAFEYGTTTAYGSTVPASPASAGSGTGPVRVVQKASGLKASTLYHYRLSTTNATGTFKSADRTFTTPAALQLAAATEAASNVQAKAVTLNGAINPAGVETTYQFEYGPTESYGSSVPVPGQAIGAKYATVSQEITGLKAAKSYHFRLKATQGATTKYGADRTFITPPGSPTAVTEPATYLDGTQAILNGTIQPGGEDTLYRFEYTNKADFEAHGYANSLKAPALEWQEVGSGSDDIEVSQTVFSLKPGTTYYFRVTAENAKGGVVGDDETFTTREWATRFVGQINGRQTQLTATSCTSSSSCIAVGYNENISSGPNVTLAERRNSLGGWEWQKTPNPSGAKESRLEDVSCASSSECIAIGYYLDSSGTPLTLAERWNGSAWAIQATPNPAGAKDSRLEGVSCASASACTASGFYVNSSGTTVTLAESWNGSEWTIQTAPNPAGATKALLHDVSCASASECIAVGESAESGKEPTSLAERWNGNTWAIQSMPEPTKSLTGVSCSASTWCMAVGDGLKVERWNGSAWSRQTAASPGESAVLKSVFCKSLSACTVVGDYSHEGTAPLAEHWDGSEWAIQTTTDPLEGPSTEASTLEGVSCESAYGCTAVGYYVKSGGYGNAGLTEVHLGTPQSTTEAATGVAKSEAILNATVNPNGEETTYKFEYGTSTSYGTSVPVPAKSIGSGAKGVKVSEAIGGLSANTTYHFRVVAENAVGITKGGDEAFTILSPCKGTEGKCEWKTQPTPDRPHSEYQLSGVSCASASVCVSVGTDELAAGGGEGLFSRPILEFWNGSEWAIQPSLSGVGRSASGISCPSTTWCMAIGTTGTSSTGVARAWPLKEEGSKWQLDTSPNLAFPAGGTFLVLRSVSCSSTTACTAVGSYYLESEKTYKPLVERWNGTSWSLQSAPNPPTGGSEIAMLSVSCASSTSCTTVGLANKAPFVERWNGTSWSIQTAPVPSPSVESSLEGISCSSTSSCMAVGSFREASGAGQYKKPLTERWNGSEWSVVTAPSPSEAKGEVVLSGVSCASSVYCTAVGRYSPVASGNPNELRTLAEYWDGSKWAIQSSPNSTQKINRLAAVSCSSAIACTAVGDAGLNLSGAEADVSLAERYE
jgi:hypothetical protein